ncbi:hypothetical protein N7497_003394 [Penicillium chrysogenum]|nr:hypothetical protein N7497_003394 [Penicillium chrysogenum]
MTEGMQISAGHLEIRGSTCRIRRTWKRLLDGHCGVVNVKDRDTRYAEQPCQVAAVVPQGSRENGGGLLPNG